MADIEFVDGLMVKAPRDGAPDFVKGSISIKRVDLGNWLRAKDDEWINLDIKVGKTGKWYVSVDNWKPDASQGMKTEPMSSAELEDMPF